MSSAALVVENLSKRYWIGTPGRRPQPGTLAERVGGGGDQRELWALRDVSFQAGEGEVLGVIGPNGAGKSTLLKLLSGITEPSAGRATLRGRVASLLEIGTGFHPELTGRENIYLNGAILGLRRREIDRRFGEIVEFAELERFLDTPVKRYSSGMVVRLGFAVAAHLEAEILIVDEALAVGDAAFQRKCLGKMSEVSRGGRTVLFVSHSMPAIRRMCPRVLLLRAGRIEADGPAEDVIARYLAAPAGGAEADLDSADQRQGPRHYARLRSIALSDAAGRPITAVPMGRELRLRLAVEVLAPLREPEVGIMLQSSAGQKLHHFVSTWEGLHQPLKPGSAVYQVIVPGLMVYPGSYTLTPWIKRRGEAVDDHVANAIGFEVLYADVNGQAPYFHSYAHIGGAYAPSRWELRHD